MDRLRFFGRKICNFCEPDGGIQCRDSCKSYPAFLSRMGQGQGQTDRRRRGVDGIDAKIDWRTGRPSASLGAKSNVLNSESTSYLTSRRTSLNIYLTPIDRQRSAALSERLVFL